jgi:hypothetical protein
MSTMEHQAAMPKKKSRRVEEVEERIESDRVRWWVRQ